MSYESNIYFKRLNKFGNDYQSRIEGKREYLFADYIKKSIYKVEFYDNDSNLINGILLKNKQDDTKTLFRLLLPLSNIYNGGTIFVIKNQKWMILWLEDIISSGYNAYSIVKLNTTINWKDRDGFLQVADGYFFGPMDINIKDSIRSGSIGSSSAVYREALKFNHFITPKNTSLNKDDYIVINEQGYIVTGFDWDSTEGIMYVSLDHTYVRDETPPPKQPSGDISDDFFWLNAGKKTNE